MRLSIVFLLVFNLAVFGWFKFQKTQKPEEGAGDKSYDLANLPLLTLKSELSANDLDRYDSRNRVERPTKKTQPISQDGRLGPYSSIDKKCLLLGPYEEIVTARSHRHVLSKAAVEAVIVEMTSELEPLYWVYIGPYTDESKAIKKLQALQQQNVDSYLVTTGDYKNAISLGVYSVEKSADKVLNEQLEAGYPAKKIRRGKELKSFWLAVGDQYVDNISADQLQKLKKENISLKKQEKSCNSVALLPSIL